MEENLDDDDVQIGYIMTRVGVLLFCFDKLQ